MTFTAIDGTVRETTPVDVDRLRGLEGRRSAEVAPGQGLASGRNDRYGASTLELQHPHFLRRGVDIGEFYPGTLNLSIAPSTWQLLEPDHVLSEVAWFPQRIPESFSLLRCGVESDLGIVSGLVYFPHPETKAGANLDDPHQIQVLAPLLPGASYGSRLWLRYDPDKLLLS